MFEDLPKYQWINIVGAIKIGKLSFEGENSYRIFPEDTNYKVIISSKEYFDEYKPQVGGYFVVYKNGDVSFSPSDLFEYQYKSLEKVSISKKELISLADHELKAIKRYEEANGIACPDCGKELFDTPNIQYLSNPPRIPIICQNTECGFSSSRLE